MQRLKNKMTKDEIVETDVPSHIHDRLKEENMFEEDEKTLNNKGQELLSKGLDKLIKEKSILLKNGYLHLKQMYEMHKEFPQEIIDMSKEIGYDLTENKSKKLLENAEIFEVDEKTVWILNMTDNQIFSRKCPYDKIIIDCNLNLEGLWFKGFLITRGNSESSKGTLLWTYWGEKDSTCTNPLVCKLFDPELDVLEEAFTSFENEANKKARKVIKKLKVFVCNFLDFLNNPEVRIVRLERGQKNIERRKREGKEPLPSSNKIIVSGVLKQYMDKTSINTKGFNHRFWVRGHFRRFWNKKRYSYLYDLLEQNKLPDKYEIDLNIVPGEKTIMIWHKPFIKGEGVLVTKNYELKKTK